MKERVLHNLKVLVNSYIIFTPLVISAYLIKFHMHWERTPYTRACPHRLSFFSQALSSDEISSKSFGVSMLHAHI